MQGRHYHASTPDSTSGLVGCVGPESNKPDPARLKKWVQTHAAKLAQDASVAFSGTDFAEFGDFDRALFQSQVEESLGEATYDARRALEG